MSWVPWVPRRSRSGADSRVIVVAVVAVVVVVAVMLWGSKGRPAPGGDVDIVASSVRDSLATESGVTATAPLPQLIDLGADTCVPCKMMAPILDEMRETFEGRLDVVFIDVWKDPEAGRRHGIKVIPTQILFDENGNELFRHQGFFSREDILGKWREFGYEFEE